MGELTFTTSLWQRSEASFASTIPREILAVKGVDMEGDVEVEWSINTDTGMVEVQFSEEDDD